MEIKQDILINQYGQGIIPIKFLIDAYNKLDNNDKKRYLQHLVCLIIQSKATDLDIQQAIFHSCLQETFTPCILLKKDGVKYFNFKKIIDLPMNEWDKVLILLLNLFKIAYYRRFLNEKNNPDKWWYWDLSINENVCNVLHNKI